MIEDTYNIKLDPKAVFNLEDTTTTEVIKLMKELGVTGFDTPDQFRERTTNSLRTDLYIPYGVYHGYKHGLRELDLFSYAGLVSGFVTGLFGGFGTDTYRAERIIENRALDELNRVRKIKLSPLQEAQLITGYILSQYQLLNVKTVRRTVTLPDGLVRMINEIEGDNFSEKLRNILYTHFQERHES